MSILKRIWRICSLFFILSALLIIIKILWVMMFRLDGAALLNNEEGTDLLTRRAYLISRFQAGTMGPDHMPAAIGDQFQGEWAVGTCSMLTAALTNLSFQYPQTREESVQIIHGLIKLVLSPEFRRFDTDMWNGEDPLASLKGKNGHIGYLGHLNMMLGAYALLGGGDEFRDLHVSVSRALISRLEQSPFPYLETYPGEWYTADNMVVIASLRLFDQIAGEDHGTLYKRWLYYTRDRLLDPKTGLVVFNVGPSGKPIGTSRGSGVGWNSFYLPFIDESFARDQYLKAKKHFLENLPLGVKALREYPLDYPGMGDIDSGPVIFGLSTSGTGFIIAGARHEKDHITLTGLLLTAEIAGSTFQWDEKRRYLFAPLVGDAIMLAMTTAQTWDNRYIK